MKLFLTRLFNVFIGSIIVFILIIYQMTAQARSLSPVISQQAGVVQKTFTPALLSSLEISKAPVQLPPLPYGYDALEPYIDAETMQLHHDKHHAAYVDKLNQAFQNYPDLQNKSLAVLLQDLETIPEEIRTTIRNNGGGHLNHTLFWQIMTPNAGGEPTGMIAEAINNTFGSFDAFKQQLNQAGTERFGSGWAWLVCDRQGQLQIVSTSNQDSPIMNGLSPILGIDVWEHAYYLKYQNRRAEYLDNWWSVVNWAEVNRRFAKAVDTN